MFGLGAATRIYVAVGPTDMRKGFEGLFGLVNERLGLSPLRGHLFLFANARWNRLKVLYWDGKPGCGSAVRQTIHNARKGYLRVLYPYHPYYGQTFEVFGSHGGLRDLVYIRMPNNATRGIPAWMFDETICASIRCADRQTIDCWALLKLAQLLDLQVESRGIGKHESSIPESKIASKIFHRQTILALEKLPLNGQMPSGVRCKCVTLIAELLRSVVFKSNCSKWDCDEQ